MLQVIDFLRQLDESEHLALANAIGEGLHQARMAAECLTQARALDPDPQHANVVQLLAYLSTAIERLQAARSIVQRRA